MDKTIITFEGRPLEELTKEELIEAVKVAFKDAEFWKEMSERNLRVMSMLRDPYTASC
jgi:hypothetical protein